MVTLKPPWLGPDLPNRFVLYVRADRDQNQQLFQKFHLELCLTSQSTIPLTPS